MAGPLEGIRVLDFSRVLAGPYCSMLLGDLGAEVIKIERPGQGDDTRFWGPPFVGGQSAYFLCCNRNKKSVTLDLHSAQGRELARQLADRCDVLLENFLPGTMDGWGLGYEALAAVNSRLVYCSITGFGQTGPYRDRPGYDILIQGLAGVMSITGDCEGPPLKVGVAISDITAGLFASQAILAALLARQRTGRGDYLDVALFDTTLAWLANVGANYLATGEDPKRYGNAHPSIVPYQVFETADQPIVLAVGNDEQWQRLCRVLDRGDLAAEERYATNRSRVANRIELVAELQSRLATRPAVEWLQRFTAADIPCGPVNTLQQVFADPQLACRQMLVELEHPTAGTISVVGPPVKARESLRAAMRPPPTLGQHTDDVLQELLELSSAEIEALRQAKIV